MEQSWDPRCCYCCIGHIDKSFCSSPSECGKIAGAARVTAGCSTYSRRHRHHNSSSTIAGMPVWEYVFLRRVAIRDRVQSTWFRPVFAAYASAQAESKRLLAANFSAVALAAASTAAAAAATDISTAATAREKKEGTYLLSVGDAAAATASSTANSGGTAPAVGRAAAATAARAAAAAAYQSAATVVGRDGQTRHAIFPPLFPAGGDATATASSGGKAASATSTRQDTTKKAIAHTAGAGSPSGSTFNAPSLARHFRRAGVLRGAGSSSSVGSSVGETLSVKSETSSSSKTGSSSSSKAVVASSSPFSTKETIQEYSTLVGSREALQLQLFLQQELQQQLQQQQAQQLRLLAASSFSALYNFLLDHNRKTSSSGNNSQDISPVGGVFSILPSFCALKGGRGAAGGEAGDFAAAAASVLQQQRDNTLAVQLLQQQVEQLQKQLEEKTTESGVLRRLVTEREEDLKEKEKEIADSKKACSLLQSERKHLNKALHAAQQEGMEKALENERYLRELLRHKEAEAVRLNEVQQLYVSLMHQQQQHQQLVSLPPRSHDTEEEEDLFQQPQQDRESPREPLQPHQRNHGDVRENEKRGAYAGGIIESAITAVRKDKDTSNFLAEAQDHEHYAVSTAAAERSAATAGSRAHVDSICLGTEAGALSTHSQSVEGAEPAPAPAPATAKPASARDAPFSVAASEQEHHQHKIVAAPHTILTAGCEQPSSVDTRATGPKNGTQPFALSNRNKVAEEEVYVQRKQEESVIGSVNFDGFVTPTETGLAERCSTVVVAATVRSIDKYEFSVDPASPPEESLHSKAVVASIVTGQNSQANTGRERHLAKNSATVNPVDNISSSGASGSAAVLPRTAVAPAHGRKTSVAADESQASSQQFSTAGQAAGATGTTETVSKSGSNSSCRPSVVTPLLQLLSLSPSWARGAGRTVLRGSPRPKPIVTANTNSSSSSTLQREIPVQSTSATIGASGAAAAAQQTARRDEKCSTAVEKTVEEEDAEWGVVGYTSHSRRGSGERRQEPLNTHPRRLDLFSRKKSSTSAAADSGVVTGTAITAGAAAPIGTAGASVVAAGSANRFAAAAADSSAGQSAAVLTGSAGDFVAAAGPRNAASHAACASSPFSWSDAAATSFAGGGASEHAAEAPAVSRGEEPCALSSALPLKDLRTRVIQAAAEGSAACRVEEYPCAAEKADVKPSYLPAANLAFEKDSSGAGALVISRGALAVEGCLSNSSSSSNDNGSSSTSSSTSGSSSGRSTSGCSSSSSSSASKRSDCSSSSSGNAADSLGLTAACSRDTGSAAATGTPSAFPMAAVSSSPAIISKHKIENTAGQVSVPVSNSASSPNSPPVEMTALLRSAAAVIASHPISAAVVPSPLNVDAAPLGGSPAGPAASAAAAVMTAFACPAANAPLAGCFRQGGYDHRNRGGGANTCSRITREISETSSKEEETSTALFQRRGHTIQPPVKVRQRLLAHRGPVHACCAVPPLWSSQLLSACSRVKSSVASSSVSSMYSVSSRCTGNPGEAEEEEGPGKAFEEEHTSAAAGLPRDFVLTCGQDGFLALIDATRGYLAYSFLVSPFKSALLCVDAAADRPLAVVAAADVSLYTVDTVNQRVIASLKGHSGRITACGFLRSGEGNVDLAVSSNCSRSTRAATAAPSLDNQSSMRMQKEEEVEESICLPASHQHLHASPRTTPTHERHFSPSSLSSSDVISESGRGSGGVHTPATENISRVTLPSSTSSTATAAGGGGSRRVVPRTLELLVTRALKGATGDGSATLWSSGLDRTVRFWDVDRSACVQTTKLPSAVTYAAASPCGEWLAAAHQNGAVSLINARTERGQKIATLQLHDGEPAVGVAFHPSGRWLVSVGQDKQVKVVDVRDWREVYALLHIEMRYNVVQAAPTFSPDGNYVVAAAGPHVFCWSLAEDRLHARSRLLRQRETGDSNAAGPGSSPLDSSKPEQQRRPYYFQGPALKKQQLLQFSREWNHRVHAEELRTSTNNRYTAYNAFAATEDWQPPVRMQSQTSEIVCLDWQLPHFVTGNKDGSVCFWG